MHFKDVNHVDATAWLGWIASTWLVAFTISTLVGIVEEGCTIALLTTLQTKVLHARNILAEAKADIRRHLHPVLLRDVVMVPNLLIILCVEDATDMPFARDASLLRDHVFPRKLRQV
jgi:hypothetical protein